APRGPEKGALPPGSVLQMSELARGLARRGHRVRVVSRPGGELAARSREEGVPFEAVPLRHEFDLASARVLPGIFDHSHVDVVHAHKGIAPSAALFAGLLARRKPVLVVN